MQQPKTNKVKKAYLIQYTPHTPHIAGISVASLVDPFGGHVIGGTTDGLHFLGHCGFESAQPKVSNLDYTAQAKHDVCWFEV